MNGISRRGEREAGEKGVTEIETQAKLGLLFVRISVRGATRIQRELATWHI